MTVGAAQDPRVAGLDTRGDGAPPPPLATDQSPLPTWFVVALAGAVVACVTAGIVGLGLLVAGWYRPLLVFAAAGVALVATVIGMARRVRTSDASHLPALAAVGLATAFLVLAGAFHSEHLLTDRDPGIYVNTGRSIARSHELHPVVRSAAFSNQSLYSMRAPSFGEDDNRLQPNFFPLLPVLLALGWSVGGDTGLLLVPALLGALGALACYAIAAHVVGARAALFALVFFLVAPFQLWFSRDAYSELVVQLFVLGGVWLYLEARIHRAPALAIVAGLTVAAATLARIDAILILIGIVVFMGVDWARTHDEPDRRRARGVVASFAIALGVGVLVARATASDIAGNYLEQLEDEYRRGTLGLIAAVVCALAIVLLHHFRRGWWDRLVRSRATAVIVAVVGIATFVWAYWIRPKPDSAFPEVVQPLTRAARRTVNNWYYSYSLHWFESYIGFVALVGAVVGLGLMAWLARRGERGATAVFLMTLPVAVAYFGRPSIAPDQPWAMRRFLPVVIPAIAIALALVLASLFRMCMRLRKPAARAGVMVATIALAAAFIIPSVAAAPIFVDARMQDGALDAVHSICDAVSDDGAILVHGYAYLNLELPQTLRGFCGVPTATPRRHDQIDLQHLSERWSTVGRQLYVVTGEPAQLLAVAPDATEIAHVTISDAHEPERTKNRRPQRYLPRPRQAWVFAIPGPASR
jgi:hypothetical protein